MLLHPASDKEVIIRVNKTKSTTKPIFHTYFMMSSDLIDDFASNVQGHK